MICSLQTNNPIFINFFASNVYCKVQLNRVLVHEVKDAEYEPIDKKTLKRLIEIQGLDHDTSQHVFATIKAAKLKNIAAL